MVIVGTLVAVFGASTPGSCSGAGASCTWFPGQAANAILAAKVLWVFGLALVGGASGIRLQGGLLSGHTNWTDGTPLAVSRFWANVLVLLTSLLVLLWIMASLNASPTIP